MQQNDTNGRKRVTPEEKFGVILADPPWHYNQYRDSANGAAKANYICHSTEDLTKYPVADLGTKDCVLCMWATGPKIDHAMKLIEAWGFQHKTMIPWLKNSPKTMDLATNMGIWFMGNAEYILFAVKKNPGNFNKRRGKLGVTDGDRNNPSFWMRNSERKIANKIKDGILLSPKEKQHSKKPETLQDYLETFNGPYLELFATRQRPGWTCWGYDLGYEITKDGIFKLEETNEYC